jgi:hypothetical protein
MRRWVRSASFDVDRAHSGIPGRPRYSLVKVRHLLSPARLRKRHHEAATPNRITPKSGICVMGFEISWLQNRDHETAIDDHESSESGRSSILRLPR